MFRIQDILATKKSLKMLLDQNHRGGARKSTMLDVNDPIQEESVNAESDKKSASPEKETKNKADRKKTLEVSSEEDDDEEEKHMTDLEKKRRSANRNDRVYLRFKDS